MAVYTVSQALKILQKLPAHDNLACGTDWDLTCAMCLKLWEGNKRQGEIPLAFQRALGFRQIATQKLGEEERRVY